MRLRSIAPTSLSRRGRERRSQRCRTLTAERGSSLKQRCAEDSARYRRSEDGIDNPCRSGLIRQRIPMSTAPLVCQICKKSKSPQSGMIAELIRPSLLEIRHLHEKLDHLLRRQYNRLFEIQQIQIELLQEIGRHKR